MAQRPASGLALEEALGPAPLLALGGDRLASAKDFGFKLGDIGFKLGDRHRPEIALFGRLAQRRQIVLVQAIMLPFAVASLTPQG